VLVSPSRFLVAGEAPHRNRPLVRQRRGQGERLVRREVEELLETQVRQVALGAALDDHGPQVVARHLGAQQVELRLVPHLPRQLRLPQRGLRLRQRGLGDVHQLVGEPGVEVGLRHVQRQLRALRGQGDLGHAARRLRDAGAGLHGPAVEGVVLGADPVIPGVLAAEARAAKPREGVGRLRAAERLLQRVQPLLDGERGVGLVRRRARRARGIPASTAAATSTTPAARAVPRRRAPAEAGELRRQGARVGKVAGHLRQELAAGLDHLPPRARDAGAGHGHRLAGVLGQRQRLVQRERGRRGGRRGAGRRLGRERPGQRRE
jgi:hypothetical protein